MNRLGKLDDFETWLRRRRLVSEKEMSFVLRWVERFQRLQESRPREPWQDTLSLFLRDLEQGQVLDRQLRQAGEAVTLYCGQYCVQKDTAVLPPDPIRDEPQEPEVPSTPRQIITQMQRVMQLRHYSPRTEASYVGWARRFMRYLRHTGGSPSPEHVRAYLSYLATTRNVASSTQNQAFNALLFLCRNVLFFDLSARHVQIKEMWKLKWHRDFNTAGYTANGGTWPTWMTKYNEF
jgi:hypothetical protein